LSVVAWNIFEGLHRPLKETPQGPTLDTARLVCARTVLADLQPDVLLLNEALWCRPFAGHFVDYAQWLGFPYSMVDTYDGAWGNVLLSRFPLRNEHRFRIHNRGGLRATVQAEGWSLDVATYHPHPNRRPAHKAQDFRVLLAPIAPHQPGLVAGDFNAISPADAPDLNALAAAFTRFVNDPRPGAARDSATRFIESGEAVFPLLTDLGWRDAGPPPGRRYSIPTDLISADKTSAMRLDHLWVNAAVHIEHAEVIHHPAADRASDHYPVWAQVRPRIG
jgi:endonuclease/exonuclease/phosphatase family metal-dependent hydrolase